MVITSNKRAKDYDEIKPLIRLCREGKLFEIQEWISAGKPVNPPLPPEKKARKKGPLQVSIDKGFHSLVQILLEAGANIRDGSYNALEQALENRRLDLIKLIVQHGAEINSVEMIRVFEAWYPAIMEYFIGQGADVETDYPLAAALCWKIRTALGIFKRHKAKFSSFQDQVNMALRYHCKEGSLKWVSLLMWAGADPFAKGPESPDEDYDPDEAMCALEYAALYKNFEIFKLKGIRIPPDHPIVGELLRSACWAEEADFLIDLIKQGFDPTDQEDCGSSLLQTCIQSLPWSFDFDLFVRGKKKDIDTAVVPKIWTMC